VPEDYVHRIGRTGRAGSLGEAMSLVCVDELKLLKGIEHLIKSDIRKVTFEGYEPDPSIKPEPIQNGRNNQRPRNTSAKKHSHSKPKAGSGSGSKANSSRPKRRNTQSSSASRPDNFGNR